MVFLPFLWFLVFRMIFDDNFIFSISVMTVLLFFVADDMGLGKTLTSIALILKDKQVGSQKKGKESLHFVAFHC